jgi:hypothetical protein
VNAVRLFEAVNDLGNAEAEHPKVDRARKEYEPELLVRRERVEWLDPVVAARAPIPRDLDLEDHGLGRREVGDRALAHLERDPEPCPAVGALLEGEAERR